MTILLSIEIHILTSQCRLMESHPCKYHAQRIFWMIGEHVVGGLAIGGVGDVGDQIFDGQLAGGHQAQDQIAVSALLQG